MIGWNSLFFTPGEFKPDPKQTAEWNRGAYLVEGLGHCGACHTPKDILGAAKMSRAYQGGEIQNWFAPDLTGNERSGLGSWSADDITAFLKTGHNDQTTAYGPMAEVVRESTSKMTDQDLKAIATYVKALPASMSNAPDTPDRKVMAAGQAIYHDACSACHQLGGEGVKGVFPTLKGDAVVQSDEPITMLRIILNGGRSASTSDHPSSLSMPSFGWKLSDEQIAALATYIRNEWGNKASPVRAADVSDLRGKIEAVTSDY